MPKIILRCNYLKDAPTEHLENFIRYIGTREGVEKMDDTIALFPATANQKKLIQDILNQIDSAKRMHEYYDYIQKPTRGNASEFITQALEQNVDLIAKKKNYMDYVANRPGVERQGTHGLFSDLGVPVVLSQAAEETANHKGVIWTNVISLRREDAERLGYDSGEQWRELLRSKKAMFCKNFKIDSANLKWYAAFHNESHHPHVHLVVYSAKENEGYLTNAGIEAMRSELAHDIFRQDFMNIYERQTKQRNQLKLQTKQEMQELVLKMQTGICDNPVIVREMNRLCERLMRTGGKKVYGYLKADVKRLVDGIVNELVKEESVAECYRLWLESRDEILKVYQDTLPERIPLSEQKEFKSIKNMVIAEAVKIGSHHFIFDEESVFIEKSTDEELHNTVLEDAEFYERTEQEADASFDWEETDESEGTEAPELEELLIPPSEQQEDSDKRYYVKWTLLYKEAREYLYGMDDLEPDFEAAYEFMMEEAENGNALAIFDIGKMHQAGLGREPDEAKAQEWYQKALTAFRVVEQRKSSPYIQYRIGKMYQYGYGTPQGYEQAVKWFSSAVSQKHKYAQYSLGGLYHQGLGVGQDFSEAFRLYQMSAKQGNAYAAYETAKMYEEGTGVEQSAESAEKYYKRAFQGFLLMEHSGKDDKLLYRIGKMYLMGTGTEKEIGKAEAYFEKSANLGNAHAQYQLAKLYLKQEEEKAERLKNTEEEASDTIDIEKIKKAVRWLEESAEEGNEFAAYTLGNLYTKGILLEKEIEKAVYFYEKAAKKENAFAMYQLGKLYLSDEMTEHGVVKDVKKAVGYLERAAGQGNEYAAYTLGKLFLCGEETAKDITKAVVYLTKSAEAGNQYAQYFLGRLYLSGEEIPKDISRAVDYLTKSAEAGNQYAQYALGKLYLIGFDTGRDEEKAVYWLTKSAEQGNLYAAYLLEHKDDGYRPDLLLSATRFLHHLGSLFAESGSSTIGGMQTDKKLRSKIQEKKRLQGHAEDDHVQQMQL